MNYKPILFSTPMGQALLEGRKTQTRRIFKVKDPVGKFHQIDHPDEEIIRFDDGTWNYRSVGGLSGPYPCPFGAIGDVLWVRESFIAGQKMENDDFLYDEGGDPIDHIWYKADGDLNAWFNGDETTENVPWKPSIHMPKAACRLFLQITDIRVERLQSISEEDAKAEGIEPNGEQSGDEWFHYMRDFDDFPAFSPQESFFSLWEKINGKESLDANPYVWVISFLRINKPDEFPNTKTPTNGAK